MLNTAIPGDERNTTTPSAMLGVMHEPLLGNVLSRASKERLLGWLIVTKTGLERLRAGLPAEYRVGDNTGTGKNGATNDLAIACPPSKPPILVAAYSWARLPAPNGSLMCSHKPRVSCCMTSL